MASVAPHGALWSEGLQAPTLPTFSLGTCQFRLSGTAQKETPTGPTTAQGHTFQYEKFAHFGARSFSPKRDIPS